MLSKAECEAASSALSCEVLLDGSWTAVSAEHAHMRHRDDERRCVRCQSPVMTVGSYTADAPRIKVLHNRQGRKLASARTRPGFVTLRSGRA